MNVVKIGKKSVGDGFPVFVIAEAGCNHNSDIELAKRLVDCAKTAAADIVKFQTYHAELMYSRKTPIMAHFRERMGLGDDATMFDLIKATELPYELHPAIVRHCDKRKIMFASTPFDEDSVDFLEQFDPPVYKIASFEMVHYPLIRKVARTKKPVILSTGMSSLGDIEKALSVIHQEQNDKVILLHCVSNYPAVPEDYNLRVIETLKKAFNTPVGISDHTPGIETALIAVAAGANIVEKHITVDQSLPGPDHHFSLDPKQLNQLVSGVNRVSSMLGTNIKQCLDSEMNMKHIGRRSLVAAIDIRHGETLSERHIAIKRPGYGIHPEFLEMLMGKESIVDIEVDTPLTWEMFLSGSSSGS